MASSDDGLYDVAFKPKLLRSLLREFVPDEKHSFTNPSDLVYVVNAVKTHGLLTEFAVDQKLINSWKSAGDAWVTRLTTLMSSKTPDKVWAALCLLGLTCQECNAERFLTSYRQCFHSIFTHIQTFSGSHFVRVASFASMSDLLTRLGEFPSEKKDGTSLATKLVLPVLKLLNEDASDFELEEAVCLLCKLINVFPSSVSRHYDNVEASIFSRFMSENGSINLFKKLGHCLVMLPKSRGNEDSWSLMIQKVILFFNNHLTLAFQGLEEETAGNEVVKLLVPPGKDPPPPLGSLTESRRYLDLSIKRSEQVLVSRVSILMSCCGMMLTNSYPVQVPVPARPLIALAKRVLMVNGSLSPSSHLMTITRHEFICSELPTLHICSLDLLCALVKGLKSQLLPQVADITRMLTDYIDTCSLPEPRIKVYSVLRVMLSLGIGIAIHLVEVVINNAFIDLDSSVHEKNSTYNAPYSKVSEEGIQQPSHKKRKHAASTGLLEEETPMGGLAMERSQKLAPISVRIAALELLEALLTVAGAFRSDGWRSKVDHLLITVASNACKGGLTDDRGITVNGEATPIWQDHQFTALRALLASLLSPGRARPSHLARSLELFHKGTQETDTKTAEYCQHALLALEVLIHPRALPLVDFQAFADDYDGSSLRLPEIYSSNHGKNTSSLFGAQVKKSSQTHCDDDLYERWMVNGETEVGFGKNSRTDEDPSRIADNLPVGELLLGDLPSVRPLVASIADAVAVDEDEMVIESVDEETYPQLVEFDHNKGKDLLVAASGSAAAEFDRLVSGNVASNSKGFGESEKQDKAYDTNMEQALVESIEDPTSTARDMGESQYDGYDKIVDKISVALLNAEKYARMSNAEKGTALANGEKGKGVADEVDYIPDIVDGDPDSE